MILKIWYQVILKIWYFFKISKKILLLKAKLRLREYLAMCLRPVGPH